MSVEKWNKWVARFEDYMYRTMAYKLLSLAVFMVGVIDYMLWKDYGDYITFPCTLIALALFFYNGKKES